jgi:two-component system chemotaxis response regulator CheV
LFIDALHSISPTVGCYAVSNGEEALFALLHEDLKPDYIITDLNMPRMNGLEFLKRLRQVEKFQSIPVIMFSSHYSEDAIAIVKQLGVTAFYSKTRFGMLAEILKKYFAEPTNSATIL